jgi:Raf kinase inhibitor-like YbhB/YbcL family protein
MNKKGKGDQMFLTIVSAAFAHHAGIPRRYTCDGANVSPPLAWSGAPDRTRSLALIMDDPDAPDPAAPKMTWVHWVLYNIPPGADRLPEAVAPKALPKGTLQGLNDWKQTGYGGPCPPIGRHRYFHKLYALDIVFEDLGTPAKATLEKAMKGHILAEAELIGTYRRPR